MADPTSRLLGTYRLATALAHPLARPLLGWRLRRGKEDPERTGERYGIASLERPSGTLLWVHAASVGETVCVLPLIERLMAERDVSCLLTTATVTSARVAAAHARPHLIHQYVPLDAPRFIRRFLDHWKPDVALFAESELWPNMIVETAERGARLGLVNARLSPRSFTRWQRRAPAMIRQLLTRFDVCVAQSEGDGDRLKALGAPDVHCSGNLKFDVPAPGADEAGLALLGEALGDRPRWAAVSTHPGEEDLVFSAHAALAKRHAGLVTVIAPRHPARAGDIAQQATQAGLTAARRSLAGGPPPDCDLFIVDTIGELGLVFRLAPACLVGGSLIAHGGQNPIEPAKLDSAILHGPHVTNFADVYAELDAHGGARRVDNEEDLGIALDDLLSDDQARGAMTAAARAVIAGFGGALERTVTAVTPLFDTARAKEAT